MKVYRISVDVRDYQSIAPKDESIWGTDALTFDCQSKATHWMPPVCYVINPKLRRGNCPYLGPGILLLDGTAREKLEETVEMAGELLPVHCDGFELWALNVLECISALDAEKSRWRISPRSGARLWIENYAFYENRFPESSIFKIPETSRSEILTYSGVRDPQDEFITQYTRSGLTGLTFVELWSG